MGMLISHNLIFNFSHITQASVSESVINSHYYMSINQEEASYPFFLSFWFATHKCISSSTTWACMGTWEPPLMLVSPFHGAMISCFTTHWGDPPWGQQVWVPSSSRCFWILENSRKALLADRYCPLYFISNGLSKIFLHCSLPLV